MPTYITLISWTQKGIENVKESPARLDAGNEAWRGAGAEIKAFYSVMGRYSPSSRNSVGRSLGH